MRCSSVLMMVESKLVKSTAREDSLALVVALAR